jgi:hypothetical protein
MGGRETDLCMGIELFSLLCQLGSSEPITLQNKEVECQNGLNFSALGSSQQSSENCEDFPNPKNREERRP